MTEEIKEILDNVKKCCEVMKDENFVVYQKQDIIKLLNYITNLQKENENLLYEINGYLKEKEKLKERCDYLQRSCDRKEEQRDDARAEYMEQEDYKQRNEKAVEYIKERKDLNWYADGVFVYELENILQGGDE